VGKFENFSYIASSTYYFIRDIAVSLYLSEKTRLRFRRVQRLLDQLHTEDAPKALLLPESPRPHGSVIVFTGSFNPPTIAHIAMLKQAQRFAHAHQPMQVYAAFSKLTVDKERVERPLLLDRIMLLQQVLQKRLPHAGILLFNRGLYVEQAEAIRHSFHRTERILFLMGFDKIVQIFDPHYYEDRDAALQDLFRLAELLVAPRGHSGERELTELLNQPQNQRFARYVHSLPLSSQYRQVSSTSVREGGKEVQHEIPQEVRQFMRDTRAYAPPLHKKDGTEVDYYGERMKALRDCLLMRNG
jgi:nicotinic acid mononucleotide adenylyltransferase